MPIKIALIKTNKNLPCKMAYRVAAMLLISIFIITIPAIKTLAQAPVINYGGAKTFYKGTALNPVTPTASGVTAQGYNATPQVIAANLVLSGGVVADAAGNVYLSDQNPPYPIVKIPAGGGAPVTFATNDLVNPQFWASDAYGNIYATTAIGIHSLVKIIPGSTLPVSLGAGPSSPFGGIAVDPAGNVYFIDDVSDVWAIKMIPAGGGSPVTISSVFGTRKLSGLAVDAGGNLYTSAYRGIFTSKGGPPPDTGNGQMGLLKIPAGGGPPVLLSADIYGALVVDAAGNIYAAASDGIREISAGSSTSVLICPNYFGPYYPVTPSVTIDGMGNIYFTDGGASQFYKTSPTGGYFISPNLPAGLTFDTNTGKISGTPTMLSPATNYTVTAHNSSGMSQTTINIKVTNPVPAISYSGPQTFTKGKAITPVTPTSSGVGATGYSTTPVLIGNNLNNPTGVAADAAGNVYIVDNASQTIIKMPSDGGAPVTFATGINMDASLLAVDGTGIVFGTHSLHPFSSIVKIPAGSPLPTGIFNGGLSPLGGITADAAGNVYFSSYSVNPGAPTIKSFSITKIPAGGGPPVITPSAFGTNTLSGLAVDAAGNLYTNSIQLPFGRGVTPGGGRVGLFKIPDGGGSPVLISNQTYNAVTIDASGNVFVSATDGIREFIGGTGNPVVISPTSANPATLATDGVGNVYYYDDFRSSVYKITPVGGYFISPDLPAGLTFDTNTGKISGTPTVLSPATNYTVTAYNMYRPATATINLAVNVVNSPAFSYSGANTYAVGTAISPLAPTGAGSILALAYRKAIKIDSSGLSLPNSVALDATGNVYLTDAGKNAVYKLPAGGGSAVSLGSGFYQPAGVVVNAAGDVFVADAGNAAIKMLPAGGGAPITLGGNFIDPLGIAIDTAGNVFVSDYYSNNITKIPVGGDSPVVIATGFNHPLGMAVDGAGNIFVADANNSAIVKLSAKTYTKTVISNYFYFPTSVAVDASGNIYVGDEGSNTIYKIATGTTNPATLATGLKTPAGVATDGAGNVFIAEQNAADIKEIKPSGGYFINTMLPAGLAFNNKTGVITGTPTASSPAVDYSITGYNASGSGLASTSIAVNGAPNFSYDGPQTYTNNTSIGSLVPIVAGLPVSMGFTINPALPTGLFIDMVTGTISGKPTVTSALTSYTITGTNGYGSSTAIVKITVVHLVKPTIATTGLLFTGTTGSTTHISWINGNGRARVVFMLMGSIGGQEPANNTTYVANPVFGSSPKVGGSAWYCVYNGSGSGVDVSGLSASITYRVTVQEYNGSAGSEMFLPSGNARGNVTTLLPSLNNIFLPADNSQATPLIAGLRNQKVEAYNILSPNGDVVNDIWVVKNIAFYPNNKVSVYDKSGAVVFSRKNYANDWAGTCRGSVLQQGTYYYLIDLGNGTRIKGFITVVRD